MLANQMKVLTLLVTFIAVTYGDLLAVPDYIKVCHKSNPQLDKCIQQTIAHLKPYLISGIPELDIPTLEPLDIGDLLLAETPENHEGITITAKDIVVFGAANFDIMKLEIPEYGRKYTFKLKLPQLYVTGRYIIDGKILSLPIKGSGRFTGNYTNGIGDVKLSLEQINKGGATYLRVKKMTIKITVAKGTTNLENLFGGNKQLGLVINESINNNFDLYAREIIPLIERSLAKRFIAIGNKIIERYTEEQLFPLD